MISTIDLKLKLLKDRKIDSKEMKNFLSYSFDLEAQSLPRIIDKSFKIYTCKLLNHTDDYLILGTNKGLVILRFLNLYISKPDIIPVNELIDLNSGKLFFYEIKGRSSKLIEKAFDLEKNPVSHEITFTSNKIDLSSKSLSKLVISQTFDNKSLTSSSFSRYTIKFSHDGLYMSTVDVVNNIYTIYQLYITEELRYSCKAIKFGKCTGELEWCPYDNIYAVTTSSQVNQAKPVGKSQSQNINKILFSLTVFKIHEDQVSVLYLIDDLPCHRLFGGHYIGIMSNLILTSTSKQEDLTFPGSSSNFTYNPGNNLIINFYNWTEKIKLEIYLSEEPKFILSSRDLYYMIIVFQDKYIVYSINSEQNIVSNNSVSCGFSLKPLNIIHFKIVDAFIYENFILIFITDKGIYYQIINEDNGNTYPMKLLKPSDEMNLFHFKISKKIKEKNNLLLFDKKLLPCKILGIYDNTLFLSSSFNQISFQIIDNILFKIVNLILKRRFEEIHYLLTILEKKYIKSVLGIFKYYFEGNDEMIRKIFGGGQAHDLAEMTEHFMLYRYDGSFLGDYFNNPLMGIEDKNKFDKILRTWLVKNINGNNLNGINDLYQFASQAGL